MITTLYGVYRGWFPKRGSRKTSTVGVCFFGKIPGGLFKTCLKPGEKFTFVLSERIEKLLTIWLSEMRDKRLSNLRLKARIIANLTSGLRSIFKIFSSVSVPWASETNTLTNNDLQNSRFSQKTKYFGCFCACLYHNDRPMNYPFTNGYKRLHTATYLKLHQNQLKYA